MIKATELRLNNYVLYNKECKQVKDVVFNAFPLISVFDNNMLKVEPILLTSEILEKCGFFKYNEEEFYINHEEIPTDLIRLFKRDSVYHVANSFAKVQYLHQLQNLYFALTGEELDVAVSDTTKMPHIQ